MLFAQQESILASPQNVCNNNRRGINTGSTYRNMRTWYVPKHFLRKSRKGISTFKKKIAIQEQCILLLTLSGFSKIL